MKRLRIDQLQPGMVLGQSMYNDGGGLLLRRGVELTSTYIKALAERGFVSAYVHNGIADDIEPQELVSQKVRAEARKHTQDLFDLVYREGVQVKRSSPGNQSTIINSAALLVASLSRDVESIVEEVLSVDALDGVISLKSHDNYTFEHSVEVGVVAVSLGKRLALPMAVLRQLALGGLLHDIGKLFVSKEILNKTEPLSEEEFAIVRHHAQIGYDIVKEILPDDDLLARHVIWQHHERQDGTGYPRGLKGHNSIMHNLEHHFEVGSIFLPAEIAAVADIYSALASDRPYRQALEMPDIVKRMQEMAGSHLNREIVRRFLSILPVFPLGTEVVILSGDLKDCRGVVVDVKLRAIDRPTVRVLFDPNGKPITPFEIDTSKDNDIELAAPAQVLHAEAEESGSEAPSFPDLPI